MAFKVDHFKLWNEFLHDKNKNLRRAYFQEVSLKMRGKIWEEFVDDVKTLKTHIDFFDWWKIVKSDYIKTEYKEINASTSQTKEIKTIISPTKAWKKSRDQSVDTSTYPPFEEVEINWNGVKILAAPFKEVNGNSDLEKIKSQNNYTNQMLQVMSQQMEQMEKEKPKRKR